MGVCLCKEKVEDGCPETDYPDIYNAILEASRAYIECEEKMNDLIDSLVQETLDVIGRIVDNEPEPPMSMAELHSITGTPSGWVEFIKSLMRVIPIDHPMGASVIALLLDDSQLPTKDSVREVANMISLELRQSPQHERNLCVILGCLAEKLAGPNIIAVFSESTLSYLLSNLDETINPDVILFSLIALEKFAQTSEHKATIRKKIELYPDNPLIKLEKHCDSTNYIFRQIGFCARWCLDNYCVLEDRKYSFETVDTGGINVMLNTRDVSEYLKISPDGIEARCDAYSFESVRCTYQVNDGCWYYEVLIITSGVMQIGWATKDSNFLSHEGYGIGDDHYSMAFDGCRKLIWHNAKSLGYDLPKWKGGSVLGCLLDLDAREIIFSLDGVEGEILKQVFVTASGGFFAAASFMSFQQCRFNFGSEPFRYPPKNRNFNKFNEHASLKPQDKIVLPRHLYLEQLRKSSVREDSCTLCFDRKASIKILPCNHSGFCTKCAKQLQYCPMCRGEIESTIHEPIDSPTESSKEFNLT